MVGRSKSAERTAMRYRRPSEHNPPPGHHGYGGGLGAPTKPTRSVSIATPPTDLDRLSMTHQNDGSNWHHMYSRGDDLQDGSGHLYRY